MKAVGWAISPLLKATGLLKTPSTKTPFVPRPATRDDARTDAERRLELARRRGGAADIVAGPAAEAPAGGKTTLGS